MSDKLKKVLKYVGIGIGIVLFVLVVLSPLFVRRSSKEQVCTVENVSYNGLGGVSNVENDYAGSWTERTYLMNNTLNITGISVPYNQNNFTFTTASSLTSTTYQRYGLRFNSTSSIQWYTDTKGGYAQFYSLSNGTWSGGSNPQKYWRIQTEPSTQIIAWLNANGTWLNAPVVNYVNFHINNQSFTVEEETTWNTFIGSSANTLGLYVADNYVYNSLGQHLLDNANQFVSGTSMIINNVYYTYLVTDTFFIGATGFSYVPNSSWQDFVDSIYNVDSQFTVTNNIVMFNGQSIIDDDSYPVLARDTINPVVYSLSDYVDWEQLYLKLYEEYSRYSSYYWLNEYNNDFVSIYDTGIEKSNTSLGGTVPVINYTAGIYARVDFSNLVNWFSTNLHNTYNLNNFNFVVTLQFDNPLTISDLGNVFVVNNIDSITFLTQNGYSLTVESSEGVIDLSSYDFFSRNLVYQVKFNMSTFDYPTTQSVYVSFNGSNTDIIAKNNYDKGRQDGLDIGRVEGYQNATDYWTSFYNAEIRKLQDEISALANGDLSFNSLFWGVGSVPFGVLSSMLNFNILGVNILGLLTGILTGLIVLWLFKKFLK